MTGKPPLTDDRIAQAGFQTQPNIKSGLSYGGKENFILTAVQFG